MTWILVTSFSLLSAAIYCVYQKDKKLGVNDVTHLSLATNCVAVGGIMTVVYICHTHL